LSKDDPIRIQVSLLNPINLRNRPKRKYKEHSKSPKDAEKALMKNHSKIVALHNPASSIDVLQIE